MSQEVKDISVQDFQPFIEEQTHGLGIIDKMAYFSGVLVGLRLAMILARKQTEGKKFDGELNQLARELNIVKMRDGEMDVESFVDGLKKWSNGTVIMTKDQIPHPELIKKMRGCYYARGIYDVMGNSFVEGVKVFNVKSGSFETLTNYLDWIKVREGQAEKLLTQT